MVSVVEADIGLFERLCPLFDSLRDRRLTRDDWRRLFETRWAGDSGHSGLALLDDGRAVGFLGALFSCREIDGRARKFCNLTTWVVDEAYRQHSLQLLLPLLRLEDHNLVNHTASKDVQPIFEKFRFKTLETHVRIALATPLPLGPSTLRLATETGEIEAHLTAPEAGMLRHHPAPICNHLLVRAAGEHCYVAFNRVRKRGLHFTHVYHVGNPRLFERAFPVIQRFFVRRNRTIWTLIDQRLLQGRSPGIGIHYRLAVPRLYRSADLAPEQIDNLYSELPLLRL